MNLNSRNKVDPAFSMSSMTDIIFLLLIFFMLTASFVTPSGLPVNLPSSRASTIVMQKVSVTVTDDLRYFVNDRPSSAATLKSDLAAELQGTEEGVVVLHIDKGVPVENLVNVASAATELKAKVSIATRPD